jgi:hypothetical protein
MSQGAFSQAVYGFETDQFGQKSATGYGLKVANLNFKPKPTFERTRNIDPRGQRQRGRILKFDLPISFEIEPSVDNLARLRAHHQGYAAITNTATGVYTWAIRDLLAADSMASDLSSFWFEGDRDDDCAQLNLGCVIDEMDLKIATSKLVSTKFSGMSSHFSHLNDPFETAVNAAYTGTLLVRGNRNGTDLAAKITTAGALDGTAKVKFTEGATAYGSVSYDVVANEWMNVILADGNHASGDPLDPVQVCFTDGGTLTLNDEWAIDTTRTRIASPTYPSRNPLTAVGMTLSIGGTEYVIDNADIKFKRPTKERRGGGSKYPYSMLRDGTREWSIKLMRDYTDRDLYLKMLSGEAAAFDCTIGGDKIATVSAVTYFEQWRLYSSNVQVTDAGADVPNEKQLPESIDIAPFWDGSTVEMQETIICTVSSLA